MLRGEITNRRKNKRMNTGPKNAHRSGGAGELFPSAVGYRRAYKFKAPVKLRLDRDDDFMVTGKRHPFAYEYTAGFDGSGRLTALQLQMAASLHAGSQR